MAPACGTLAAQGSSSDPLRAAEARGREGRLSSANDIRFRRHCSGTRNSLPDEAEWNTSALDLAVDLQPHYLASAYANRA